jgi:Uma2 family endonuclease
MVSQYRTAADWLHDLGDVPLERILFDPPPGTATEEDLLRKVEVEKRPCELVNATLVEKTMGLYESLLAMLIGSRLLAFVQARGLGAVAGEGGTLRLLPGVVRIPDVAFISKARLRGWGGRKEPIASISPDLAVEVLSAGNRPGEMRLKLQEYFAAGVHIVWLIDPATRSADVYKSLDDARHLEPDGILSGEEVLDGFELPLAELFSEADQMTEGAE